MNKTKAEYRLELMKRGEEAFKKLTLKKYLPHLYGHKPYQWTLDFWNSTNRMKLICGGNQISKSSTLIRHCIDLATDKEKWKPEAGYFPKRPPQVFWYIYPDKNKIDEEFEEKWKREFLPQGELKDDPVYGWTQLRRQGNFVGVKFNSGVNLYFKTWNTDNQAGTCDAIFQDEELPQEKYDELSRRLTTTEGMYCAAFTATLGQQFWFEAMELMGKEGERFPNAWKKCVSAYDCLTYADGSPSAVWTEEKIVREINKCSSDAQVKMRIEGRFASTDGLVYPSFRRDRNVKKNTTFPSDWFFYGGVDIGTGGPTGHPAAISIVAIRKDYKKGRLIKFWRGPKDKYTDSSDILSQYKKMISGLNMSGNYYDWHNKEFYLRAVTAEIPFIMANKDHAFGEDLLNVLFKNQMLDLDQVEGVEALAQEFETLRSTTHKTKAKDDGIDSLRYAISKAPWDLSDIVSDKIIVLPDKTPKNVDDERALSAEAMMRGFRDDQEDDLDAIFDEINSYMEIG